MNGVEARLDQLDLVNDPTEFSNATVFFRQPEIVTDL